MARKVRSQIGLKTSLRGEQPQRSSLRPFILLSLVLIAGLLASCAPAMQPTTSSAPQAKKTAAPTRVIFETAPATTPQPLEPRPTAVVEQRLLEMEWPARLHLGDSDVVRLALVPYQDGYQVSAEFPEHALETQNIPVRRPDGYILSAIARLDGTGFDIAPQADQERSLPPGEAVAWRWSLRPRAHGQQRLVVSLVLRWASTAGQEARQDSRSIPAGWMSKSPRS